MREDESVSGKRRRLLDLKGRLERARKIMANPSYETELMQQMVPVIDWSSVLRIIACCLTGWEYLNYVNMCGIGFENFEGNVQIPLLGDKIKTWLITKGRCGPRPGPASQSMSARHVSFSLIFNRSSGTFRRQRRGSQA